GVFCDSWPVSFARSEKNGRAPSAAARITVAVVTARAVSVRRKIHRRILGKEAVRLQREADIFDRHHRKVFGTADMRGAETVPDHDILVFDSAGLGHVFLQA